MAAIEDHDRGQPGEVVFYAHGAESLRTFAGRSKLHARPDCPALVRRGAGTIVRDRMLLDAKDSRRCKACSAAASRFEDQS
jgi:hypothetical protein